MLASLMLLTALAGATEVAHEKRVGIGAHVGYPTAFTMKFYISQKGGFTFHVGVVPGYWYGAGRYFLHLHSRLQYQHEIVEFADWEFARFDMYFSVDAALNVVPDDPVVLRPGVGAGVGVELQFHEVPASVYVETIPMVFPIDFGNTPYFPVTVYGGAGGRWYF